MANDNRRRPPHGHDPEQARREAAKAREGAPLLGELFGMRIT